MAVIVRIPTQLRTLAQGASQVSVEGANVGEVLANLDRAHPGFQAHLFDENGTLRRFVNLFLGEEDVRFLDGMDTALGDGATLTILPAVAGG
ncbi:MAG: MoaD/ThiS family protein [Actinomycetota bacterium]|nr:MoaD/ThiS family protein [Actinomycetota bacterium]